MSSWNHPVLGLLLVAPIVPAGQQAERARVILEVPRAADRPALEQRLAAEGCRVLEELPELALLLVAVPETWSAEAGVARFAAWPGVGFAEPDGTGEGGGFVTPNDTFFSDQWPLHNTGQSGGLAGADIEALRAWELAHGSASVIVAVLDSGLAQDHPEFAGRVLPGLDCVNEDDDPFDDHGHGTLVSGILAANADNAFGLSGVDRACTLLPVKVLNASNGGATFDLAQGLIFAANAAADVINMSLINYPRTNALENALEYARDAGCRLIACAGNGGIGDADRSFPGRSPLTISVGATTDADRRAGFSGTGTQLDLVAPGSGVPATPRELDDGWVSFSGCSAATPMVSGIAAVALSVDPTLTHDELQLLLQAGAEDGVGPASSDLPGRDDQYGHGRANLFRTLCGLDLGGPTVVAPDELRFESLGPEGLAGDDPVVVAALAALFAVDDLDPDPVLEHGTPPHLPLGKRIRLLLTARDACGNETERTLVLVAEDRRPPLVDLLLTTVRLDPSDGRMVPVDLRAGARDVCDPSPALRLLVFVDEPPTRGESDAALDAAGRLHLRATRSAKGDGRVYLLLVRASDDAGNTTSSCTSIVVPLSDGQDSLARVIEQAGQAERACMLAGGLPPGFHRILGTPIFAERSLR